MLKILEASNYLRAMKLDAKAINRFSLKFRDANLELRFQASRMKYDDFPLTGRIFLWIIVLGSSFRRLQLFFQAYLGNSSYDAKFELRLTLMYFGGFILEIFVYMISALVPIRGALVTLGTFWSVIDGSSFYYPKEPALLPM